MFDGRDGRAASQLGRRPLGGSSTRPSRSSWWWSADPAVTHSYVFIFFLATACGLLVASLLLYSQWSLTSSVFRFAKSHISTPGTATPITLKQQAASAALTAGGVVLTGGGGAAVGAALESKLVKDAAGRVVGGTVGKVQDRAWEKASQELHKRGWDEKQLPWHTGKQQHHHMSVAKPVQASVSAAWISYNRALEHWPLTIKILIGVIGTFLGDAAAQLTTHWLGRRRAHSALMAGGGDASAGHKLRADAAFRYDAARVARLMLYSAAVGTPLAHFWFELLDKRVLPHTPTSPAAVVTKLLLDQGIMAPIGIALFFIGIKVLEGKPQQAISEMRAKMWHTLTANWLVWPLANAINFAFVPPAQRILYVNVLAVVWSAFMSHMASSGTASSASSAQPLPAQRGLRGGGSGDDDSFTCGPGKHRAPSAIGLVPLRRTATYEAPSGPT